MDDATTRTTRTTSSTKRTRTTKSRTRTTRERAGGVATTRGLGEYGEALAARYLRERGLEILERNWRCREGEIDLVAREGGCVVVCEVKTRRGTGYGSPLEAVTWRKAARLRRLAAAWLAQHEVTADDVRIDVIGILVLPGERPRVAHLAGVGG